MFYNTESKTVYIKNVNIYFIFSHQTRINRGGYFRSGALPVGCFSGKGTRRKRGRFKIEKVHHAALDQHTVGRKVRVNTK